MQTEYEATFFGIDVEGIKKRLKELGGTVAIPETLMKIRVFALPNELSHNKGYVRVRDEGHKITMALKMYIGEGIESEKESEIEIKDFAGGVALVKSLGMQPKATQEKLREVWELDGVEIMFDSWPFLDTYIEIEGASETVVQSVVEKLGLVWGDAHFGASIPRQVYLQYGIAEEDVNNNIPRITFDENPFEKFITASA